MYSYIWKLIITTCKDILITFKTNRIFLYPIPRTLVKGSGHILCWTPRVRLPSLCSSFSETLCPNPTIHPWKCGSLCFQCSTLLTVRNDEKIHLAKFTIVILFSSISYIHNIVQPLPVSISRVFSWSQTEALPLQDNEPLFSFSLTPW